MKSFQTPYERSTTATRRKAPRFSHISLWYEKIGENESKFKKDASPPGQVARTKTKRLTSDEMHTKLMKRKWFRELFSGQIESAKRLEMAERITKSISNSLTPRGQKTVITEDEYSIAHPKELPSDNT